jgi:hypothetical protein
MCYNIPPTTHHIKLGLKCPSKGQIMILEKSSIAEWDFRCPTKGANHPGCERMTTSLHSCSSLLPVFLSRFATAQAAGYVLSVQKSFLILDTSKKWNKEKFCHVLHRSRKRYGINSKRIKKCNLTNVPNRKNYSTFPKIDNASLHFSRIFYSEEDHHLRHS